MWLAILTPKTEIESVCRHVILSQASMVTGYPVTNNKDDDDNGEDNNVDDDNDEDGDAFIINLFAFFFNKYNICKFLFACLFICLLSFSIFFLIL